VSDNSDYHEKCSTGRAIVVCPVLPRISSSSALSRSEDDRREEAEGLARAIFLEVVATPTPRIERISPGHFIGKGSRETIGALIEELKPDIVIVDTQLTPVQQRNLETEWKAKVIDRTGLILEIFGDRARTKEGRLQVELAAQQYQRSRLVHSWTHLERQRGGAGFLGGPGEKQIELDRRMIDERINRIKRDIEQVRRTRDIQRKSRERVPYPIVALVGYTNAGKSTLFNRLTGANVFAEDLPFATLDPTMRALKLPDGRTVILSDTVGFIADLPTHLVAAFRATLEEVELADVILHVRDMAGNDTALQREEVLKTLGSLGIEAEQDPRIIEVQNKIDALPEDDRVDVLHRAQFKDSVVAISAINGEGTDELLTMIAKRLSGGRKTVSLKIPPADGEAVAWLYAHGRVLERADADDLITLKVDLDPADWGRFESRFRYGDGK
jgi:GTP-binding protein HflX